MGKHNKIDHVAALIRPENFDAVIAKLSYALQTSFYGPYDKAEWGIRVAVSLDAGIELVTPLSDDADNPLMKSLDEKGERWTGVVIGVRDMDETCSRLAKSGHEPQRRFDALSGDEPFAERLLRLEEAMFDPAVFGGLPIVFAKADLRSEDD